MWNRIKAGLYRFMSGRYGVDELNRFLLWTYLGLLVIGIFIQTWLISALSLTAAVFMLIRMLSRNRLARIKENQAFLKIKGKTLGFFSLQKNRFKDRKTHIYRACPSCKATLRLPKVPGEHSVVCPRCKNRFDVKVK